MTDILMPALSPTMEEGTLAKWLVAVGDTVKAGDVIAEIETDKATMEVEAVDEGVVESILVGAGTEGVKVNAVIAKLKDEGALLADVFGTPRRGNSFVNLARRLAAGDIGESARCRRIPADCRRCRVFFTLVTPILAAARSTMAVAVVAASLP